MSTALSVRIVPLADEAPPEIRLYDNGKPVIDFGSAVGIQASLTLSLDVHYDPAGYLERWADDMLAVAGQLREEAAIKQAAQAATRARYTA